MDESHDDQNFRCKIKKIWSKTCVFCCKKYPIHTSIVILFFLLYLFFPLLFKVLIYTSPLFGLSLLVHKVLSDINHQKIKQAEEDARRKKFARSRRSFKSIYSDRDNLIRRNTLNKSDDNVDTNVDNNDDIFLKSLHELLSEKKPKDLVNFESISGKGEGSSSNSNVNSNSNTDKDDFRGESWDVYDINYKPKYHNRVVRWTDDDQKNEMDLGLSEAGRNKRLESLMVRRRSRKNLGFEEKGSRGNDNNNVQIPNVKTKKINPFLEDKSSGNKSPGSAPSSLLKTSNPFDLPYDPHEEKLDLTGYNFHEEFTVNDHPKEPVFCRHQSFSLGALSHSAIGHGKHDIPYYKDLSNKQKSIIGFETSTLDNEGHNKHIQHDSSISDDTTDSNHPKEEDGTDKEIDSYDARKADINFFYRSNKRVHHAVNHSMVSDMQVELSDEETAPTLDDLDIEKDRQSRLNSSTQADSEMNENPKPLNSDTIQRNHIHELHGASQSSVAQAAPDGLTELAVGQASVSSNYPKSVLHQTNDDSDEHPFGDRDIDNLQDQNVSQV